MGNKNSYDEALNEKNPVKKIGREADYKGGCCWPTYREAKAWVDENGKEFSYIPHIYVIVLPNSWEEDTSDDTYESQGFYSLLTDSVIEHRKEMDSIIEVMYTLFLKWGSLLITHNDKWYFTNTEDKKRLTLNSFADKKVMEFLNKYAIVNRQREREYYSKVKRLTVNGRHIADFL